MSTDLVLVLKTFMAFAAVILLVLAGGLGHQFGLSEGKRIGNIQGFREGSIKAEKEGYLKGYDAGIKRIDLYEFRVGVTELEMKAQLKEYEEEMVQLNTQNDILSKQLEVTKQLLKEAEEKRAIKERVDFVL